MKGSTYEQDFSETVLGQVSSSAFRPMAYYDPDGDCIEFLNSAESFRAERLDKLVTVYYGRESGLIMGSLIKGVKSFIQQVLEKNPGFKIEIRDRKIKLVHLFTAKIWLFGDGGIEGPEGSMIRIYETLREYAQESDVEAELGNLCTA